MAREQLIEAAKAAMAAAAKAIVEDAFKCGADVDDQIDFCAQKLVAFTRGAFVAEIERRRNPLTRPAKDAVQIAVRFVATCDSPASRAGGYYVAEALGCRGDGATAVSAVRSWRRARKAAKAAGGAR